MAGPKDTNNPPPIPEPEIPRNPADDRMREEVKDDSLYIDQVKSIRPHQWVYTIIPLLDRPIGVIFTAYCKVCRSYFTEKMPVGLDGIGLLSKSSLPRYGCEPISDDVTLI